MVHHRLCFAIVAIFFLSTTTYVSSSYIPQSILGSFGSGTGGGGSSGGAAAGGSFGFGQSQASQAAPQGPVTTAIESTRTVEVKPIQIMNEPHEPQVVEVPSEDMPVTVHFKSQSSRVLVQQTHQPAQIGEPEHTTSEDEPQRVIHEVVKPVIQEIREIIQPYRRLIQQVQPVIEQTHTVIAKGEPRPPVEPISVEGASPGSLSGVGGGGRGGASGRLGGGGGGGKYGGGGGGAYAASASSVSIKSASPSPSAQPTMAVTPELTDRKSSVVRVNQQPQSYSLQPVVKSSAVPNQKYAQQQQMHKFASSNSAYASRRGDFREPQQTQNKEPANKSRMSMRPAPTSMNMRPTQTRVNLVTSESVPTAQRQQQINSPVPRPLSEVAGPATISESYQPSLPLRQEVYQQQPQQQQKIEARYDDQPIMALASYPLHSYAMPYEENLSPMITFIAQPVRFRARA